VKFRRQHQLGPFILDFFAPDLGLAIEVDGSQHFSDAGAVSDAERTRFLKRYGVTVLRFSNAEVMNEVEAVAEAIRAAVAERSPHPRPLPEGEGD
jgi:very-short-patch-repair endonuclease